MILVTLQHPNPYFDDSYAVNSANLGPYGDAITYELIPHIEKLVPGHRPGLGPDALWRVNGRLGIAGRPGLLSGRI